MTNPLSGSHLLIILMCYRSVYQSDWPYAPHGTLPARTGNQKAPPETESLLFKETRSAPVWIGDIKSTISCVYLHMVRARANN